MKKRAKERGIAEACMRRERAKSVCEMLESVWNE